LEWIRTVRRGGGALECMLMRTIRKCNRFAKTCLQAAHGDVIVGLTDVAHRVRCRDAFFGSVLLNLDRRFATTRAANHRMREGASQ
jgi:hypothetical protein